MEGKGKEYKNKFHSKPRNLISTIADRTVPASQSDRVWHTIISDLYYCYKNQIDLCLGCFTDLIGLNWLNSTPSWVCIYTCYFSSSIYSTSIHNIWRVPALGKRDLLLNKTETPAPQGLHSSRGCKQWLQLIGKLYIKNRGRYGG